jgi:hypothetical protein
MSDTLTPNLGLKKPVYDGSEETWGYSLNDNADILDAVLATTGASAKFVPLAGGTMTGGLTLPNDPSTALQAATKQYVDAHAVADAPSDGNLYGRMNAAWTAAVPIAGGTMTGALELSGDPSAASQAATKNYVDTHATPGNAVVSATPPTLPIPGQLWWDTVSGQMFLSYTDANSTQWVVANSQPTGIPDAPNDANTYARHAASWVASPTNASVAAAVAPALNAVGRSYIHNGLMNIAQRGAGPWTTNGAYTADRWEILVSGDTVSVSIAVNSDATRAAIGDEAALQCLVVNFTGTSTGGAYTAVVEKIENVRRLSGKTVTVSFWASASVALNVNLALAQIFGTGGSPSAPVGVAGQNVAIATAWGTRYSLTFALPSAAGKVFGTTAGTDYTQLGFYFSNAGAAPGVQAGTVALWGVQLELGGTATPLEKLDPRLDLANCQRFYQASQLIMGQASGGAGANAYHSSNFPMPMRAAPTVTPTGVNLTNCGSLSAGSYGGNAVWFVVTVTANGAFLASVSYTASADL